MSELKKYPADVLELLQSADPAHADALLKERMSDFNKKIIVLDDDPTGVQTVHDVSVYTDWEEASLRMGFQEENPMFFILTNSRAFSEEETIRVHTEIAERICKISKELGKDFFLVSRGDSTLRGHYPLETDTLAQVMEKTLGISIDGDILCPFFPEGGRYTFGNIHYVKDGDQLIPAGMTEFAKDKTFGYQSSDLTEYIEEKTKGAFRAEGCIVISQEELRECKVQEIREKLLSAEKMDKIVVNAVSYADLKVFCAALAEAFRAGKHFVARTAAALPKVIGQVRDIPLLTKNELVGSEKNGGIVLIGSHVKKTTAQLLSLQKTACDLTFMEFHVNTCFEEGGLERETASVVEKAQQLISDGKTVVIYTSRELLAPAGMSKEEVLKVSVGISDAVTSIIGKLNVKPKYIIAKGGITSSDVGTKALRVKKATVLGQVKKGIPVWLTGEESKFPGMPYIIFPGNVGEVETLREIVEELER